MRKTVIKKVRVNRIRNGNTMTESQFWQMIRSTLRNRTRFWVPKNNCIKAARRVSQSKNKRLKWEFQCSKCKQFFPQKMIEAHHSEEAGSLKSYEDLPEFVRKLFSEDGWIALCKDCHKKEHE